MPDPATNSDVAAMWIAQALPPDSHAAFRGTFETSDASEAKIRATGAAWFALWLDGEFLTDGPVRCESGAHEFTEISRKLAVGKHVLAAHVHHVGVPTRLSPAVPPFLAVAIEMDGKPMKIDWKCDALHGYRSQVRRINP